MTDKEIALQLGLRLIKAKLRVAAMAGELDSYRDSSWSHIPWRSHVEEIIDGLAFVAQERAEKLKHALDVAKPEDSLYILHKFLEENF